jgi:outer membrane protein TolC
MIGSRGLAPDAPPAVRTVSFRDTEPAALPRLTTATPVSAPVSLVADSTAATPAAPREVVVSLDSVLSTAEAQNARIALARKRVEEAAAAECQGHCHLSLLLHCPADCEEGGSGPHAAAARTWQRRLELAQTLNETLLDAGNTYFDLLTARRGEAVGRELARYQDALLRRAEDLLKSDPSAAVLAESMRAEKTARRSAQARLHQQGDAAAAKLAYLLNLPPETVVVPQDASLEPVDLVDVSQPASVLVARAQAEGPGVRELSGLMAAIEEGINSVRPCLAHLPKVARQLEKARFKSEETRLAFDDLRGKLALGVVEAREASLSGRRQISDVADQIRHAAETYRLNDLRLTQNAPGASVNDVSQSIRGLELAHFTNVTAIAAYNKAQLRLLLLLGRGGERTSARQSHP